MSTFASRLKDARLLANKSQVATAKALGTARQTYLDVESGKTEPRLTAVITLSNYLECCPSWLAFGNTTPEQQINLQESNLYLNKVNN